MHGQTRVFASCDVCIDILGKKMDRPRGVGMGVTYLFSTQPLPFEPWVPSRHNMRALVANLAQVVAWVWCGALVVGHG